ncbi:MULTISPECIES: redox-sensing transcriptional repressor Rex [Sporolactobacillus]|uniref:Redox-sensing transcriptional repressor Rex n=2 Tax=Sporolactobacillus TaxID=2077 RepID=A0A0U1QMQ0_9BACL|nr:MULTISPECIES: redox-sensing transcriptional repressor Rex [Sporolactobacillus]KLI02071.1 redox-sensing transcriptional repressor Rex [Sporolactobacillus inulinus CASD]BBO00052.1 redox-sensing transcriptional repressor Rex [Sporolactobacillus terrae]GEB77481.1 redox-sensing transcriptional repressor Rex [Sporolactobacillus inulinus]
MASQTVPQATAERLPLYYRTLQQLVANGKTRISSSKFGELVQIDSTTIRKDFSYFGALGRKGYGYDTQYLMDFLKKTLYQDELNRVILIGVGHLGTALLNHNFLKNNNTQIVRAYDVDPKKIGTKVSGTKVFAMDELAANDHHEIVAAILTVPAAQAQEAAEKALASGIRGFLNFSPTTLNLPENAYVRHVDMTVELQALIYFLNHSMETKNS